MTRKLLVAAAILAVLAAVGVFLLGSNLGPVVKAGIERFGPEFTQSPITVAQVKLSPRSGSGSLDGFVVGNPAGYTSPHALRIGRARFQVKTSSLLQDKVVIEEFVLEQPEITLEGGLTENNLQQLQANLDRFTAAEKDRPAGESRFNRKLQVNRLRLAGARVDAQLRLPAIGSRNLSFVLPDLELSQLGAGPEGITPAALGDVLIHELIRAVLPAVTAQAGNLLRDPAGTARTVKEKAGKAAQGAGDLLRRR